MSLIEISSDHIGNQSRYLPACSILIIETAIINPFTYEAWLNSISNFRSFFGENTESPLQTRQITVATTTAYFGNLTEAIHSFTHGAEPFLKSRQLCSYSRTYQHFMEPEGSLPCSLVPIPNWSCYTNKYIAFTKWRFTDRCIQW
jgi:hypothetical protein